MPSFPVFLLSVLVTKLICTNKPINYKINHKIVCHGTCKLPLRLCLDRADEAYNPFLSFSDEISVESGGRFPMYNP